MRKRISHPIVRVVVAIMGAAFVHSILPPGVFGNHDVLFRALVTGAAAGVLTLVLSATPTNTTS
jgi:hypothetical protein